MTPPLKPFPTEAFDLASAQDFQKTCQQYIPDFDLNQVMVANRSLGVSNNSASGDSGIFDLLFTNSESDKFCSARVHWPLHEMEIKWGDPKTPPQQWSKKSFEMKDACTFTQKVAGNEEFDGQVCKDESIDERLIGTEHFKSVQYFRDKCQVQLTKAYRRSGEMGTPPRLALSRVQILNPSVGDGNYSLIYQKMGLDFFCRADIDTTAHNLGISYGPVKEKDNGSFDDKLGIPLMTDDCSMTRSILGEKELVNPQCKDHTEREQQVDRIFSVGGALIGSGLFYYFMYSMGKRFAYAPIARALAPRLAPFAVAARTWLAEAIPALATRISPTLGRVATGFFERAAVTGAGTAATGFSVGRFVKGGLISAVLIYGLDKTFELGVVGDDYKKSINKRVADLIYEKNVNHWHWSDAFILPLALRGIRAGSRAIAPNAMEWGIARDHPDLVEKIIQADKENSEKAEEYMSEVLPTLLHNADGVDANISVEMLREPIFLNYMELMQASMLRKNGPEFMKEKYQMSDEDIETLSKKALLKDVQESAKFLVLVQQTQNDWAREIFNSDGTLKGGQEYQNLIERFPYDTNKYGIHSENLVAANDADTEECGYW